MILCPAENEFVAKEARLRRRSVGNPQTEASDRVTQYLFSGGFVGFMVSHSFHFQRQN